MNKKITTLAELEREQEKLKMLMDVTRQEFSRNLGTNRKELKNYLLKNVALPAGALGLGAAAVNQFSSNNNKKRENSKINNNTFTNSNSGLWKMLFPLAVNLLQSYFLKKRKEKLDDIPTESSQTNNPTSKLRTVA